MRYILSKTYGIDELHIPFKQVRSNNTIEIDH